MLDPLLGCANEQRCNHNGKILKKKPRETIMCCLLWPSTFPCVVPDDKISYQVQSIKTGNASEFFRFNLESSILYVWLSPEPAFCYTH